MHWEPWWPKSGTLEINFEFRDLYIFTLDLSKHVYEWMNEHFWPLFRKQCSQAICRFLFWFEVFLHFSKDRPIKAFQDNEPVANYFTYSINPTSQLIFLQINVLRDVNGQTVYFILDFQKYFELDFVQVLHVLKKKINQLPRNWYVDFQLEIWSGFTSGSFQYVCLHVMRYSISKLIAGFDHIRRSHCHRIVE